jgi:hypothetical protein
MWVRFSEPDGSSKARLAFLEISTDPRTQVQPKSAEEGI